MKKLNSLFLISVVSFLALISCQKEESPPSSTALIDESLEFRACAITIDPPVYVGNCTYWVPGPHSNNSCPNWQVIVKKGTQVIANQVVGSQGLFFSTTGCNGGGTYTITINWGIPGNTGCNCSGSASYNLLGCGFESEGAIQINAGQNDNCSYYLNAALNPNIYWKSEFLWTVRRGSFTFHAYSYNPSPGKMLGLIPEPDEICYYRVGSNSPGGACFVFYKCIDYTGGNPDCN